jgi:uncharacterized delta-60 repeat protein
VVAVATTSYHTLALLGDGSPHVTVHPWNRSVRDGAAVSFSVKAVGISPLNYQWQRNGTDILNETNATLAIAAAHGGNAGVYRAVVRNARGSATTRPAVLAVEGAPTGVAQPILAWDRRHAGAANSDDIPFAMTTDRAGNVYVAGVETVSNYLNFDFVTLKYDDRGTLQWTARYNGPGNFYDFARAIAVDDAGNVYVAGDSVGADREYDIAVIKYDANGNQLWLTRYDGPTHERDVAVGVQVDRAGQVFVGGSSGWYNNERLVMLKLSASGQGLWTNSYRIANRGFHQARAMALDGAGNTYLTGGTSGETRMAAFVTTKFGPNGNLEWAAEYSGPARGGDRPNSLAVDSSGNVYVTGQSDDADGDWAIATVKYDYAGRQLWATRYKAPHAGYHFPDAVRVDGAGNAYVSGVVAAEQFDASRPSFDFTTLKYDPLGRLLWAARHNGSPNPPLWATDLALDRDGNAYVTGAEARSVSSSDFVTMKYSPDGNLLWLTPYDGPAHGADSQTLIALTQAGEVFVSGRSQGQGDQSDIVTVKYAQTNIVAAPIMVVPPQGQTVVRGNTAIFVVVATGVGLRYQWRLNGQPIPGQTNAALQLTTALHPDRGDYSVEVRNAAGWTVSPEAVLTVVPEPRRPGGVDLSFRAALGGEVSAMVQQPDGRVLVAGYFVEGTSSLGYDVVRFNADGTVDGTFQVSLEGTWGVNTLALQPDGKVILGGGFERINGIARPGLARVNADGTLDTSYNPPNLSAPNQTIVFALSLQPDGKVVVGGWSYGAFHSWIARFHPDGTLDGMFVNRIGNAVYDMAVQPDGKILVAGDFTGVDGAERSNLFRLNADGSIDAGFNPEVPRVFAMALQPDGRILLGGDGLIRLHSDGGQDASFNAELPAGWIQALTVQPNGQVLVGTGGVWDDEEGVARYCLERVNRDGSRDASFANDTLWAGGDIPITALVLHRDGSIWVGGQFRAVNGLPLFGLVRLYGDSPSVAEPFVRRRISQLHVELAAEPKTNTSAYAVEDQPPAGWLVKDISHGGIFDLATGKVKFGPFFDRQSRSLSYAVTPPAGVEGVFLVSGVASADGVNTPVVGDDRLVISGAHPADTTPVDWAMAIAEVTAYGAAWRTGGTWVLPPNPIPIDYVTRAAALWRGGECYEVSPTVVTMPLWWVNCGADNGAELAPAFSLGGVTRQLPLDFIPGESLVVTVQCVPPSGTAACAIEDQPPAGWQIDRVSAGGDWDAVNGRVKWGPFLDATPRTLTYQITPSRTANGSVAFNGSASFDGISSPISGPSDLREACRLQVHSSFPGQFWLTLSGRSGVLVNIEASSDLRTWTVVGEMTTGPTPVSFVDSTAAQFPQRFYRAREQ